MEAITYSSLRSNLASVLDQVNDDHTPMMITRRNGKPAVVMSLEDFNAYDETAYLMASPRNSARINRAISDIEAGKSITHELIEK
ncbi:MAG: type II toxin-antitoxin system prevent-host-death family antitoxin [Thiotrichales bacterium]|jgi:antitoxin YefM|nr:type II toxin-antitoxin system prevent-host-death family antitoxin [Thiotrichales bacterium]MBT3613472.1 type II toxin-antitoxin system prevent-host-death family antitoxin [Thiotrichales bacterium]MBT3753059.1 type II toxin-antitoxin system prevent-host-death family antitoxin [Thiotrichales bacterium]MBT3837342.1 type II toxin-antitoxin system prevent-host-death family antitoxin [Thiotrichales bacterium]MBT4151634.1 type II toxin-antitoxin system prevent-host-death family antitoxin [Thiotric